MPREIHQRVISLYYSVFRRGIKYKKSCTRLTRYYFTVCVIQRTKDNLLASSMEGVS